MAFLASDCKTNPSQGGGEVSVSSVVVASLQTQHVSSPPPGKSLLPPFFDRVATFDEASYATLEAFAASAAAHLALSSASPTTSAAAPKDAFSNPNPNSHNDPIDSSSSDNSRFSSSGFSSASSDSADTSLTSVSNSSTSRQPSPSLRPCCHLAAGGSSGELTATGSVSSIAGSGTLSVPSSPLYFLSTGSNSGGKGSSGGSTAVTVSGGNISENSTGGGSSFGSNGNSTAQSLSSSFSNTSFFLPGPALSALSNNSPVMGMETEVLPPSNFGTVAPRIYRSSFPKEENFTFLKSLGLKSLLTLVQEEYPADNLAFLEKEGIKFFQFSIPGNKEPFVHIPEDKIRLALAHVLDIRNHPMLIHCNKGKHRTGCLIGCLRKMMHWSSTAIFDEYRRYSFPKSRNMDQQFIELFDQSAVWDDLDAEHAPEWLDLTP